MSTLTEQLLLNVTSSNVKSSTETTLSQSTMKPDSTVSVYTSQSHEVPSTSSHLYHLLQLVHQTISGQTIYQAMELLLTTISPMIIITQTQ